MITVSKTWQMVNSESAKRGDYADHGYCFSPMFLHLKDLLQEVRQLGSFEVQDNGNSVDLYGVDEDIDYVSGESTTYHIRIVAKPRVLRRIIKLITY